MIYLALLRGVNVGGKAMVSMAKLKACFETLGFSDVKTYINSGNVLFRTDKTDIHALTKQIEAALAETFGLPLKALIKTHDQLKDLVARIPADWVNDANTKCDVLFLWPAIDKPELLHELPFTPGLEETLYTPGVVVWRAPKPQSAKTRLTRIVGTPLYHQMTVRNCNTARKLLNLADEL